LLSIDDGMLGMLIGIIRLYIDNICPEEYCMISFMTDNRQYFTHLFGSLFIDVIHLGTPISK